MEKVSDDGIDINNSIIERSPFVKYLGVHLDSVLAMKEHITNKCRIAMINIIRLFNIRRFPTKDACHSLLLGLVISHLDYANVLFMGLPECQIKKLQRIQNMAAKLVLNKRKYDSSTECMRSLHWLPIGQRVKYKALTLIYKSVVTKTSPVYLQEMFKIKSSIQHLRSAASLYHLDVPKTNRKTFVAR